MRSCDCGWAILTVRVELPDDGLYDSGALGDMSSAYWHAVTGGITHRASPPCSHVSGHAGAAGRVCGRPTALATSIPPGPRRPADTSWTARGVCCGCRAAAVANNGQRGWDGGGMPPGGRTTGLARETATHGGRRSAGRSVCRSVGRWRVSGGGGRWTCCATGRCAAWRASSWWRCAAYYSCRRRRPERGQRRDDDGSAAATDRPRLGPNAWAVREYTGCVRCSANARLLLGGRASITRDRGFFVTIIFSRWETFECDRRRGGGGEENCQRSSHNVQIISILY